MTTGVANLPTYTAPGDQAWREYARCRDAEPELFFEPNRRASPQDTERRVKAAKAYCGRCPVRLACLAEAVAAEKGRKPFGVFGGMTATEREAARRAKRRAGTTP